MGGGRARRRGRPAHAGGLLAARRAAAGVRRVRAEGVRQLRRAASRPSWRGCSIARRRWSSRRWPQTGIAAGQEPATCSTWAAARACAARCWRRTRGSLVGVDLSAGMLKHAAREDGLRRAVQAELTDVSAAAAATSVRRDRHRRHPGVLRRRWKPSSPRRRWRCGRAACSSSPSRRRPMPDGADSLSIAAARPLQPRRGYVERLLVAGRAAAGDRARGTAARVRRSGCGLVVRGAKPATPVAGRGRARRRHGDWRAPWLG